MNGSTVHQNLISKNDHHKMLFSSKLQNYESSEIMGTFKDYLEWDNNKDFVPTLEALQKLMKIYHEREKDMQKLGYTLPKKANNYLHSSTTGNFFPFTKNDKDILQKIRSDMMGGPFIVFTREAVVGETKIRFPDKLCKTIIGIDASQLYPSSMCQEIPTGLYTRWEMDAELRNLHPFRMDVDALKIWRWIISKILDLNVQLKVSTLPENKTKSKKISVDGFCGHCDTVFEAMVWFYHGCDCQQKKSYVWHLKRMEKA